MYRPFTCLIFLNCLLLTSRLNAAEPPVQVTIDLNNRGKPFRGWGTSLAWWANDVGHWPDQTVDEIVHLVTDPRDGLGMNVFRYNIGGGDRPGDHHMRPWGAIPGFKSELSKSYDWNSDGAQRRVLLKLIRASADRPILEAFSNSAPWWMTVSGCSAGSADGGPNLKPECDQESVDYLADVVAGYRDHYGITFNSLEPLNEPDEKWWKAGGSQEGMGVGRPQQANLVRLARVALDQRKLNTTIVSGTDAHSIDDALMSLRSFDQPTLAALGQINTHSYVGERREELRHAAAEAGKPLWQSESGPLDVLGSEDEQIMTMASRIVQDMNQLRPEVWCTWQILDSGAWGTLHEDAGKQLFHIGRAFYMFAAFTRHLRPGDCVINLDSEQVLATVSTQRNEGAIVVVNNSAGPRLFDLKILNCGVLPAMVSGVRTSAHENTMPIAVARIEGSVLQYNAPANSISCLAFPCKLSQ